MPAKKKELPDRRYVCTVELSPRVIQLVETLLSNGLHGITQSQVLERLICDRLQQLTDAEDQRVRIARAVARNQGIGWIDGPGTQS